MADKNSREIFLTIHTFCSFDFRIFSDGLE